MVKCLLAAFPFVDNFINEILLLTINADGIWRDKRSGRKKRVVVFDEWSNFRGMENWEDVGQVWQVQGYCRVFLVSMFNIKRTVVSGHKFCHAI